MHDNLLIAIALSVSGAGIIALAVLLAVLEPESASIPDVQRFADGAPVRVEGTVTNVERRGGITVLTIEQPVTVEAVVFGNASAEGCVRVLGRKDTHEGTVQIVARKILSC